SAAETAPSSSTPRWCTSSSGAARARSTPWSKRCGSATRARRSGRRPRWKRSGTTRGMARSRCTVREPARREQEGEIMLSSRTKQVLGCGIVVVAAMLAWTCAAGLKDMGFSGGPSANRLSLQNEQHEMRRRLKGQVGDSGVNVEDDNVIMIGVLPSSYGKDNLTRIPSEMHVKRGKPQKFTWICWDGPFSLEF